MSTEHLAPEVVTALRADSTIDITTIGARSGDPIKIEIWFVNIRSADAQDRIFITGTPGPRHWLANLRREPSMTFHLKESISADLAATAVEVTDERTRLVVFQSDCMAGRWYRSQGWSVEELVATAPMVEVVFSGSTGV